MLNVRPKRASLAADLAALPGVVEVVVDPLDGIAYSKVDPDRVDREALEQLGAANDGEHS